MTPAEAIALQQRLRDAVRIEPLPSPLALVAGCDVSFDKDTDVVYSGVVVVKLPELTVVDRAAVRTTTRFPYIPGLLSFRETPALLEVWERLQVTPDVVMLDGQGLAHPRRFGIACHVGVLLDMPALGCAKSILVGTYGELDQGAGSWVPLVHHGETVGAAVRTKTRVSPVFISAGHRIDLPGAVDLTLRCVQARPGDLFGPGEPGCLHYQAQVVTPFSREGVE